MGNKKKQHEKKYLASLGLGAGVLSLLGSVFLERNIWTLTGLSLLMTGSFVYSAWHSPWVITSSSTRSVRSRKIISSIGIIVICCFLWAVLRSQLDRQAEDAKQNKDAFNAIPGAALVAANLDSTMLWVNFSGAKGDSIAPIGLAFALLITNRKHTKAMISNFQIDIADPNNVWQQAFLLLVHGGPILWGLLKNAATSNVGVVTLDDGFLEDKIGGISLESGSSVKGWVLCELPFYFEKNPLRKLRIYIRDSAGSQFTQDINWSDQQQQNSILETLGTRISYMPASKRLTDFQMVSLV
jgi:hypothetical protein